MAEPGEPPETEAGDDAVVASTLPVFDPAEPLALLAPILRTGVESGPQKPVHREFRVGDQVRFRRAKQHFRLELGAIQKGDRGEVVRSIGQGVYVVRVGGREVTVCGPVELEPVAEAQRYDYDHCKYMIRKGFMVDATQEECFRLPVGPEESELHRDLLKAVSPLLEVPDGAWQVADLPAPRCRSQKRNAKMCAVSKLWDVMLATYAPFELIDEQVAVCEQLGVDESLIEFARRRRQRREVANRARNEPGALARPKFTGDPVGMGSVACLLFFRHHVGTDRLATIDVETKLLDTENYDDLHMAVHNVGEFMDIDGKILSDPPSILRFYAGADERFHAAHFYGDPATTPRDLVDAAVDFICKRLYMAGRTAHDSLWAEIMNPILGLTDRKQTLRQLCELVRKGDPNSFKISQQEVYERQMMREASLDKRTKFVTRAVEALAQKLMDKSCAMLGEALREYCGTYLAHGKFCGGAIPCIGDFLLAPLTFALRHRGVASALRFKLPLRLLKWMVDFEKVVPETQTTFFAVDGDNDVIDSLNEYLTKMLVPMKFDEKDVRVLVTQMSSPA